MSYRLLFIVFLVLATSIFADTLNVNVAEKGKPLSDATVIVREAQKEGYSDIQGNVEFKKLSPGKYSLITILPGYENSTNKIDLAGDLSFAVSLRPAVMQMHEIKVTGKRNKGVVTAQTVMKKEDINRSTQGFLNDALKVVQAMPGVSSSGSTFDSSMYIQGGSGFEWVAGMDGFLCVNPTRWGGGVSMFNPIIVDSIDLYSAGYPASFAQGLSGYLDVKIMSGDPAAWHGTYDLSSATMEILLHGPIVKNKTTLLIDIRRTYYEVFASLFSGNDYKGVQFPYLTDGTIKLKSELSRNDTLSFLLYGSLEGMKWKLDLNSGDASGPPAGMTGEFYYRDINCIGGLTWQHRFSQVDYVDIRAGLTSQFGKYVMSGTGINSVMNNVVDQYLPQVSMDFHLKPAATHTLTAGAIALNFWGSGNISMTNYYLNPLGHWTNYVISQKLDFKPGSKYTYMEFYAMDDWEFINSLILQVGARAEYFIKTGEWAYCPRGGIKWEITPELDYYIRSGLYNAFPTSILMLDEEKGNPALQGEKTIHGITGLDFANDYGTARIEGFYKYYYNIIENDIAKYYANTGYRNVYGGDIYLQKKENNRSWWNGWLSYTYVYGLEKERGRSVEDAVNKYQSPEDTWYAPSYLREHTISAICDLVYRANDKTPKLNWLNGWSLTFDYRILSGKPFTEPNGFIVKPIPGYGSQYYLTYGPYNTARTPWTHKLDIKITGKGSIFSFLKHWGLKFDDFWYVNFMNVYNNDNVVDYYYYVKDNELKRSATKDFGFMVLGGMKVNF